MNTHKKGIEEPNNKNKVNTIYLFRSCVLSPVYMPGTSLNIVEYKKT